MTWLTRPELIPSLSHLYPPLYGMLVHCRLPPAVCSQVPIYIPGWRGAPESSTLIIRPLRLPTSQNRACRCTLIQDQSFMSICHKSKPAKKRLNFCYLSQFSAKRPKNYNRYSWYFSSSFIFSTSFSEFYSFIIYFR